MHLIDTQVEPRLSLDQAMSYVEDISDMSVWYCGPKSLGEQLEKSFTDEGLRSRNFHRELFEFR